MELSSSENKTACPLFKNMLQELLQKAGLTLPRYEHRIEGSAHSPNFRGSVVVGETRYVSKSTFNELKAAEQDAARVAYESVKNSNLTLKLGTLHIHQEPRFTKLILHEYAAKMNLGIPKYQTLTEGGGGSAKPGFKSSINFCGKTFTGVAESKKVAEQLAAKEAVQSLLVSDSGTLHQVINSKERLYASMFAKMNSVTEGNPRTSIVAVPNTESGMRRGPEFKPTEGNPRSSMAAVTNTGSGMRRGPEFKPTKGSPRTSMVAVTNTGIGMRKGPEFKPTERNSGSSMAAAPNTESGMKRKPEFKPTEVPTRNRSFGRGAGR